MARPPSVVYKIAGSMLFVGEANEVKVSLVDIPRATIDSMALKFLAGKLTRIAAVGGLAEAQRLATSICTNGRATRKYVERLPEETILKACLVNYARNKSGATPMPLADAAKEFDNKIGSFDRVPKNGEAMKWARERTSEILSSYRR